MAKFEAGMEAMLDMFVFETSELMEKLDEILMRTERDELTPDDIGEIFRIMHTVKGSAAMMGLTDVSKLAHSLEDLFFIIREDPSVTYDKPALYELLYAGSDSIKYEIENISDDSVPLTDFTEAIAKNRSFADVMKGAPAAAAVQESSAAAQADGVFLDTDGEDVAAFRLFYDDSCMMPEIRAMALLRRIKSKAQDITTIPPDLDADDAGDIIKSSGLVVKVKTAEADEVLELLKSGINVKSAQRLERPVKKAPEPPKPTQAPKPTEQPKPQPPKSAPTKKSEDKAGAMISVKLEKLDRLMKLAQEIVIAQSGVLHSKDLAPYKKSLPNFDKSARELKKLTDELQDMVTSVRMVPVSTAFSKMNRVVRDMNSKLKKNVELVFVGEETEIDKSVADMLGDPLMHLVRNAVDHGIETPEERAASGKTEKPTVTLGAYYESNDVIITVSDNGAGMNAKKLLEKARSKGILKKPENEYTEQECFALIMEAGFSTNESVTEYSGRGVGMDVVKKNLEKVGGTLTVDSKLGSGSTFTIRVPMSLSISTCMGVVIGGQEYAVPITDIKEVFRARPEQIIVTPEGRETVLHTTSGRLFNVIRLAEHFGVKGDVDELSEGIMILCRTPQGEAALFADSINDDMQIVIKPFSAYLSRFGLKSSGFAGTSVLGDGSILLVLDVNEIMKGGHRNE